MRERNSSKAKVLLIETRAYNSGIVKTSLKNYVKSLGKLERKISVSDLKAPILLTKKNNKILFENSGEFIINYSGFISAIFIFR